MTTAAASPEGSLLGIIGDEVIFGSFLVSGVQDSIQELGAASRNWICHYLCVPAPRVYLDGPLGRLLLDQTSGSDLLLKVPSYTRLVCWDAGHCHRILARGDRQC